MCTLHRPGSGRLIPWQAGLKVGDLLLAIAGRNVNSADQAAELVAQSDSATALLLQRRGVKLSVPLRLE